MQRGDSPREEDDVAGDAPAGAVSLEMEVPLHDVDPLNVVWHGHYFKYCERARTELLRAHRLDVPDLVQLRQGMFIVDAGCRYISPLTYGDEFRVSAWITEVDPRIRIAYLVWNVTQNRRAARAYTVLVTTDADGRLLWQTPAEIRERLETRATGRERTRRG
jgi:acyl-CoA thioester hydrolase